MTMQVILANLHLVPRAVSQINSIVIALDT